VDVILLSFVAAFVAAVGRRRCHTSPRYGGRFGSQNPDPQSIIDDLFFLHGSGAGVKRRGDGKGEQKSSNERASPSIDVPIEVATRMLIRFRIWGGNSLRQQRKQWPSLKTLIPDRRSYSTGLEGNQDPTPKPRASNQRWRSPAATKESMVAAATTSNAISTTGGGGSTTTITTKEVISTKLGGRVFTAAVPVVDNAPPTPVELSFDATLTAHCQVYVPLETKEGIQTRERVLSRMTALCNEWIQSVCQERGHVVSTGQLLTSGSYRLGVHEPGADIDTILVAPAVCHRSDFFGSTSNNSTTEKEANTFRDPNSLAERIRRHPDVSNFVPVEGAAIPLLTFDWEGVNIDLLFARLSNNNIVPLHFDVDNDAVLDGADTATEKSLNGPRVTNLIAAMVSGNKQRYQNFLIVVRCVRKWAKARGLYSNKMGYWGGININIGVALTVQLYPNACAATLLRKFFLVFSHWRWPQPVLLCQPHDAGYGLTVWSGTNVAHNGAAHRQVAPMITPAYPAMNSTLAVTRQTLQIMSEEFKRAHEIIDQLWRNFQQTQPKQQLSSLDWSKLFEPSDFFIAYPVRVCVRVCGNLLHSSSLV
jgi:poly(A) polymerase